VREHPLDVQQRLEQELKRDYHIITAGKRLDQIARDFVAHYAKAWETGKAMLVCIDKITCVRMHRLIEFYWDRHIRKLEKDLSSAVDEQVRTVSPSTDRMAAPDPHGRGCQRRAG
jgi:type I restriction enzyme R subunit